MVMVRAWLRGCHQPSRQHCNWTQRLQQLPLPRLLQPLQHGISSTAFPARRALEVACAADPAHQLLRHVQSCGGDNGPAVFWVDNGPAVGHRYSTESELQYREYT